MRYSKNLRSCDNITASFNTPAESGVFTRVSCKAQPEDFIFVCFVRLFKERSRETKKVFLVLGCFFFLSWQTSFNNEIENPATQSKRPNTTN